MNINGPNHIFQTFDVFKSTIKTSYAIHSYNMTELFNVLILKALSGLM